MAGEEAYRLGLYYKKISCHCFCCSCYHSHTDDFHIPLIAVRSVAIRSRWNGELLRLGAAKYNKTYEENGANMRYRLILEGQL